MIIEWCLNLWKSQVLPLLEASGSNAAHMISIAAMLVGDCKEQRHKQATKSPSHLSLLADVSRTRRTWNFAVDIETLQRISIRFDESIPQRQPIQPVFYVYIEGLSHVAPFHDRAQCPRPLLIQTYMLYVCLKVPIPIRWAAWVVWSDSPWISLKIQSIAATEDGILSNPEESHCGILSCRMPWPQYLWYPTSLQILAGLHSSVRWFRGGSIKCLASVWCERWHCSNNE